MDGNRPRTYPPVGFRFERRSFGRIAVSVGDRVLGQLHTRNADGVLVLRTGIAGKVACRAATWAEMIPLLRAEAARPGGKEQP